jgi:hypothetical protein
MGGEAKMINHRMSQAILASWKPALVAPLIVGLLPSLQFGLLPIILIGGGLFGAARWQAAVEISKAKAPPLLWAMLQGVALFGFWSVAVFIVGRLVEGWLKGAGVI